MMKDEVVIGRNMTMVGGVPEERVAVYFSIQVTKVTSLQPNRSLSALTYQKHLLSLTMRRMSSNTTYVLSNLHDKGNTGRGVGDPFRISRLGKLSLRGRGQGSNDWKA